MTRKSTFGLKSRLAAGIAGAALVVAIPTAGLAVNLLGDDAVTAPDTFASFTPASADPRLAEMIQARSGSKLRMMRFTPAGSNSSADRAVTVAVRIDDEAAQAISVRSAINSVREPAALAGSQITSTRYNLGLARGYRRFAQAPALSQPLSNAAIPDLSDFEPSSQTREEPSRFAARIALGEEERAAPASPQTLDSIVDQSLDVAGSYRLTRNIDVTAGVRYQQDRDRRSALPNVEQQDSQAVYIGTQFRF